MLHLQLSASPFHNMKIRTQLFVAIIYMNSRDQLQKIRIASRKNKLQLLGGMQELMMAKEEPKG